MGASEIFNDAKIKSIEMKVPGEMFGRRIMGVASKRPALVIGQVACRHGVRNLGVLRRVRIGRQRRALRFAKDMCETIFFCNKFRTATGAVA